MDIKDYLINHIHPVHGISRNESVNGLMYVLSKRLEELKSVMDNVLISNHVVTSSGSDLDRLGAIYEFIRLPQETDIEYKEKLLKVLYLQQSSGTNHSIVAGLEAIGVNNVCINNNYSKGFPFIDILIENFNETNKNSDRILEIINRFKQAAAKISIPKVKTMIVTHESKLSMILLQVDFKYINGSSKLDGSKNLDGFTINNEWEI